MRIIISNPQNLGRIKLISVFAFWCYRILLKVLRPARSNQSILKEINPEYLEINPGRTYAETETPILWSPGEKSRLIGKDPDSGKDWRKRRRGQQRMRGLDNITNSMDMYLSKLQEIVEDGGAWHAAVHRVTKSQKWHPLNNNKKISKYLKSA